MRRLEKDDIEVLKAAQDIISDEANWCQKSMARNCLGKSTPVDFCQPCRWCATGAVYLAAKQHFGVAGLHFSQEKDIEMSGMCERIIACLDDFSHGEGFDSMVDLNDSSGHKQVMAAFQNKIAHPTFTGSCSMDNFS